MFSIAAQNCSLLLMAWCQEADYKAVIMVVLFSVEITVTMVTYHNNVTQLPRSDSSCFPRYIIAVWQLHEDSGISRWEKYSELIGLHNASLKKLPTPGTYAVIHCREWPGDVLLERCPILRVLRNLWWRDTCDVWTPVMYGHLWCMDTCDVWTPVM